MQRELCSTSKLKLHQKEKTIEILESINDNAYKVDALSNCDVSVIFKISYLSLFDMNDDLKLILFQEKGDDTYQTINIKGPLEVLIESITRSKAKKLNETLNGLVQLI